MEKEELKTPREHRLAVKEMSEERKRKHKPNYSLEKCFVHVLSLRRYKGHVHCVPAPGYEMYGEPRQQNGGFNGDNRVLEEGQEIGVSQQSGYPGPVTCFESSEWRSLKGPFILVWLNNVPWSGEDILPAPEAKFSDGYLDVLIIRDCPKSALLSLLLKMGKGSHVKSLHEEPSFNQGTEHSSTWFE